MFYKHFILAAVMTIIFHSYSYQIFAMDSLSKKDSADASLSNKTTTNDATPSLAPQILAQNGSPTSSYNFEVAYAEALKFRDKKVVGYSADKSKQIAMRMFYTLSTFDHVKAMHNYAMLHYSDGNLSIAYQWFCKAERLGFQPSVNNRSKMERKGFHYKRDPIIVDSWKPGEQAFCAACFEAKEQKDLNNIPATWFWVDQAIAMCRNEPDHFINFLDTCNVVIMTHRKEGSRKVICFKRVSEACECLSLTLQHIYPSEHEIRALAKQETAIFLDLPKQPSDHFDIIKFYTGMRGYHLDNPGKGNYLTDLNLARSYLSIVKRRFELDSLYYIGSDSNIGMIQWLTTKINLTEKLGRAPSELEFNNALKAEQDNIRHQETAKSPDVEPPLINQVSNTARSFDELVAFFLDKEMEEYERQSIFKIFTEVDESRREVFAKFAGRMLKGTTDTIGHQSIIKALFRVGELQWESFVKLVAPFLDGILRGYNRQYIVEIFSDLEETERENLAKFVIPLLDETTKRLPIHISSTVDESKYDNFAKLVAPLLDGIRNKTHRFKIIHTFYNIEESQRDNFVKLVTQLLQGIPYENAPQDTLEEFNTDRYNIIKALFDVNASKRENFVRLAVQILQETKWKYGHSSFIVTFSKVGKSPTEKISKLAALMLNGTASKFEGSDSIEGLTKVEPFQLEDFAKVVLPLLKEVKSGYESDDIIMGLADEFAKVDPSQREDFAKLVALMLNGITDRHAYKYIIEEFAKVDPSQREDFARIIAPMLEGITGGYDRLMIVRALASVDASQRESFVKFVIPMLYGNINQRCLIIKAFAPFSADTKILPLQEVFFKTMARAIDEKNSTVAEIIFNRLLGNNPLGADEALLYAVNIQNQALVNVLIPVTTQAGLRAASRQAQQINRRTSNNPTSEAIYYKLFSLVPHELRVENEAYAIHNYSNTQVNVTPKIHVENMEESPSASSTGVSSQKKSLTDAVFSNMQERLENIKDIKILSYETAAVMIYEGIERCIPVQKRDEARQAAFFRLASDTDYETSIQLVVSFLNHFHSNLLDQWIVGFVGESIEAYKGNWGDNISCTKGIKERTATGLRGVDSELDGLFMQAEGPNIMRSYVQSWNPFSNALWIAKQLLENGLAKDHSPENAAEIFRLTFKKQADSLGVNVSDFNADLEVLYDNIINYYDRIRIEAFPNQF